MPDAFLSILIWGMLGIILGLSNIWLQKYSLDHAGKIADKKLLAEISLFSILRVIISLAVLFFAFKNGLTAGFSCLGAFIITRWVGLAVLLVNNKERS